MNILLDNKPEEALRLKSYQLRGGFLGLKNALTMDPSSVVNEIKKSGLRGRGGAGFSAGSKLGFINETSPHPRYLVCNFDEGEPGTYKDRILVETVPFKLLEGIAICAYAMQADKAFIYCRAEYAPYLKVLLKTAEKIAREAGVYTDLPIEIRTGAGAYVCGEETALLESIEGHRGNPRFKPPYPAVKGLWQQPTVVLNVETLCNVPYILLNGAEKYASIGSKDYPGTKLIMLNGDIKNRGCYEIETGISLRSIIEDIGGGMRNNIPLKAVQIGGNSSGLLDASELDVPFDFSSLQAKGTGIGSGTILVLNEQRDIVDLCCNISEFYKHESCGKCTPCREGCYRGNQILQKFKNHTANQADFDNLNSLMEVMKEMSLCGLGQSFCVPINSCIKHFPEEFNACIQKR